MLCKEIQIWGDSIMRGVIYDEARKRYVLLKDSAVALLSQKILVPVKNFSQMGPYRAPGTGRRCALRSRT